jgi:gamma-glutamyltranspeptidase/glutathione hydrolase
MHYQWYPDEVWIESGMVTPETQKQFEAMGYQFKAVQAMGADEATLVNPKSGRLEGANDRRRPAGLAAATDSSLIHPEGLAKP